MTTDEADVREQREAAALGDALAGSADAQAAPPDALEAAALVRHGGGELSEARSEAILQGLLGTVRSPRREQAPWLRWLIPVGAAAAIAAVAIVALPGAPAPTELPRPGLALLEAQGAALRDATAGPLEREMGLYRDELHAALRGRYGENP